MYLQIGVTHLVPGCRHWGWTVLTFVSGGRLPEAAGDQVSGEPQGAVGASVDVLHQHVQVGVLALRGQLQQLIEPLEETEHTS